MSITTKLIIKQDVPVKEFDAFLFLTKDQEFETRDESLVKVLLDSELAELAEVSAQDTGGDKAPDTTLPAKDNADNSIVLDDEEAAKQKTLLVEEIKKIQGQIDEILAKKAQLEANGKALHPATAEKLSRLEKDLEDTTVTLEALEENFDDEKEF